MEQDVKRGRLNMDIVMDASWGPLLASDMDKTFCGKGKSRNDSNIDTWPHKEPHLNYLKKDYQDVGQVKRLLS